MPWSNPQLIEDVTVALTAAGLPVGKDGLVVLPLNTDRNAVWVTIITVKKPRVMVKRRDIMGKVPDALAVSFIVTRDIGCWRVTSRA